MARAGARLGVTGLLLLGASNSLQNAVAEGDTRTLSFHHVHTGEDITITFKRDGRYDEAALKKLDWFMRDWRKEQETHMDPHLFDLLWETYREVGASEPIQVICGYRSPGTNSMLRARSNGVAQFSQHINGNAIDFYIPGVPLATVRAEGLRLQRGGVGFYPTSGSPFVHLDTGTIRHWPRIPRQELAKIFPDGRTVHIPADGQPLPGYALALADVERQGAVPSGTSLEAAREAGVITASQEHAAEQPKRSLLARIFGIGKKRAEQNEQPTANAARARPWRSPAWARPREWPSSGWHGRSRSRSRRYCRGRGQPSRKSRRPRWRATFSTTAAIGAARSKSGPALPAPIAAGTPYQIASAEPVSTGSTDGNALAYAAESEVPLAARTRPMGSRLPRMPAEAQVIPASSNTGEVVRPPLASTLAMGGGERSDSPWLRAAMLTPSVRGYMTATRVGAVDPRWQRDLLHKPPQSVMMTFSADPHLGMVDDRFSGTAVVFLATTTFNMQTTAALR